MRESSKLGRNVIKEGFMRAFMMAKNKGERMLSMEEVCKIVKSEYPSLIGNSFWTGTLAVFSGKNIPMPREMIYPTGNSFWSIELPSGLVFLKNKIALFHPNGYEIIVNGGIVEVKAGVNDNIIVDFPEASTIKIPSERGNEKREYLFISEMGFVGPLAIVPSDSTPILQVGLDIEAKINVII